jgi:hypothetical protein
VGARARGGGLGEGLEESEALEEGPEEERGPGGVGSEGRGAESVGPREGGVGNRCGASANCENGQEGF